MKLSNWIELLLFAAIVITGYIIKHRSKKSVSEIEGNWGIVKGSDLKGQEVGRYDVIE